MLIQAKTAAESAYLVAPGRGITTSDGTIIFPCYSYNGSADSQVSSFIYSKDNGVTWTRSSGIKNTWSSENELVELSDGPFGVSLEMGIARYVMQIIRTESGETVFKPEYPTDQIARLVL